MDPQRPEGEFPTGPTFSTEAHCFDAEGNEIETVGFYGSGPGNYAYCTEAWITNPFFATGPSGPTGSSNTGPVADSAISFDELLDTDGVTNEEPYADEAIIIFHELWETGPTGPSSPTGSYCNDTTNGGFTYGLGETESICASLDPVVPSNPSDPSGPSGATEPSGPTTCDPATETMGTTTSSSSSYWDDSYERYYRVGEGVERYFVVEEFVPRGSDNVYQWHSGQTSWDRRGEIKKQTIPIGDSISLIALEAPWYSNWSLLDESSNRTLSPAMSRNLYSSSTHYESDNGSRDYYSNTNIFVFAFDGRYLVLEVYEEGGVSKGMSCSTDGSAATPTSDSWNSIHISKSWFDPALVQGNIVWGDGTQSAATFELRWDRFIIGGKHSYDYSQYNQNYEYYGDYGDSDEGNSYPTNYYPHFSSSFGGSGNYSYGGTHVEVHDAPHWITGNTAQIADIHGELSLAGLFLVDADPIAFQYSYFVTIDWGDRTATSGQVAPVSPNNFAILGYHVFNQTGTFNGTIRAMATDGSYFQRSFTTTVAHILEDPDDSAFTVSHDRTLTANLLDNQYGTSSSIVSGTSNGSLSLNANGYFVYRPNSLYVGVDSFAYIITINGYASDPATVTIHVVNSSPVAVDDLEMSVHRDVSPPYLVEQAPNQSQ